MNSWRSPIRAEFIYDHAPFPACHASTIAETQDGLVVAFFGGTREGAADVGIWAARHAVSRWSDVEEVANGLADEGQRYPCWNPVLFQPTSGPLLLFYKVGPNCSDWWGMVTRSTDGGQTWSPPEKLPAGVWGPIKNKPIELPDGSLLCPSSSEHDGWRVHLEYTPDLGRTWRTSGGLNDGQQFAAIQPTLLTYPSGRMQMLCRSRQGFITTCWSEDGGQAWSPMQATCLPNPNSGIDAVSLRDGRVLLVYNHSCVGEGQWGGPRSPLNVAISEDGVAWQGALVLEDGPGEYSYPAVIQTADNQVHVTYTWRRERIRHVVIDPDRLELARVFDRV